MQGLINLGSSDAISILDFAKEVARKSQARIVRLPKVPAYYVHSPIDYLVPDVSKLEAFGWNRKVNLGDAIHETLSWIRLRGLGN
jgi:nucleoside-diphosphate-sugar epimerase